MREKEFQIGRVSYYYEENEDCSPAEREVTITRFVGLDAVANVPEEIDGMSVTAIGKKAFLSKKTLKKVVLPETVKVIGDWAFAYCDGLKEVTLPQGNVEFGKSVFMECGNLQGLVIPGKEEDISALLAAAVKNGGYYLLDTLEAGSSEWLAKWDARLFTIMNTGDREGYSRQVLCGEEDYGSTNQEEYMKESRRKKIRLALLRLLYPTGLSEENRGALADYLLAHTKGCETQETWEVILKEHGEDRAYYALFAELGCLSAVNIAGILEDIGENDPEMKAFFINFGEENSTGKDFFEELEL